jgi:WXXGXW repeat (2 copies)
LLSSSFDPILMNMRNRLFGLLLVGTLATLVTASGCYAGYHGRVGYNGGGNSFARLATTVAVVGVAAAIVASQPPVVAQVEYYDYGSRPGYVWVNGRYAYSNNQWYWQNGYWQDDQPGRYWVQGYWSNQNNGYAWVDGYWAEPRPGYVYCDGYWDDRGNGYTWVQGSWEVQRPGYVYVGGTWSNYNNRRTWNRGGWQRDDGRVEWTHYRARTNYGGTYRGNGGYRAPVRAPDASNSNGGVNVNSSSNRGGYRGNVAPVRAPVRAPDASNSNGGVNVHTRRNR